MSERFAFPLCIQLPPMVADAGNADFVDILRLLQAEGFAGVELNLNRFDDPDALRKLLSSFGLRLSMVASGAYAVKHGLSLSSPDESVREAAVAALRNMRAFAGECGAGVICGFIKGAAKENYGTATCQLRKSLAALTGAGAPIYLEATNHYEATLVNTLEEGADFVRGLDGLRVLPDTYHMNIEETGIAAALVRHNDLYANLHLSDNNRYFPGFGAIDFRAVYDTLSALGYAGVTAVEGRVHSLKADITVTAAYLAHCSRGFRA